MLQPLMPIFGTFLLIAAVCCGASSPSTSQVSEFSRDQASVSHQMNISSLYCPEILTLRPDETYQIEFQVLYGAQKAAEAGIVITFLTDDNFPDLNPREAQTNDAGQVSTTVSPLWQGQQTQQMIVVGAMLLPQKIGASCSTEVQLKR